VSQIVRRPAADRDLVATFRYYAREAGQSIADRFFAEVEATFARLADMPNIGALYEPHELLYADLRYCHYAAGLLASDGVPLQCVFLPDK
jgi:plasmid stabilization system protein ParE